MWFSHDQEVWKIAIIALYFCILLVLSFYGSHRYVLVSLYRKYAKNGDPTPEAYFSDSQLPFVTVQLPIYNERYVVERLIRAACDIDYPTNRLEIQVLDDSTDDTTEIAQQVIAQMRQEGVDISLIHRVERTGYKAGALQEGLAVAKGDFVAIFDADFVPQPDFLRQTIHYFTDANIGMVQARWEHLNRDHSLLTRAQAVLLDGHFVIEHAARNRSGRFFNFNGTAGIWRKNTIIDAGGWQHHTLTEDLDLSYRAQLEGWQFIFLKDVVVPSEIPVEMNAFKAQQHRWAKGSIQTAIKLLPRIMRSSLPGPVKLEAFHHLTANFAYLLMVILALMMPLATLIRVQQGWYEVMLIDLPIFIGATLSVVYFYWVSQREIGRPPLEVLRLIPAVLGIGIGISVNNAKAVLEAFLGHQTPFVRTPKYAVQSRDNSWRSKVYRRKSTILPFVEFCFASWFGYAVWVVAVDTRYGWYSLPFLLLFLGGFLYVSVMSMMQNVVSRSASSQ